jgi:hypothetical protein
LVRYGDCEKEVPKEDLDRVVEAFGLSTSHFDFELERQEVVPYTYISDDDEGDYDPMDLEEIHITATMDLEYQTVNIDMYDCDSFDVMVDDEEEEEVMYEMTIKQTKELKKKYNSLLLNRRHVCENRRFNIMCETFKEFIIESKMTIDHESLKGCKVIVPLQKSTNMHHIKFNRNDLMTLTKMIECIKNSKYFFKFIIDTTLPCIVKFEDAIGLFPCAFEVGKTQDDSLDLIRHIVKIIKQKLDIKKFGKFLMYLEDLTRLIEANRTKLINIPIYEWDFDEEEQKPKKSRKPRRKRVRDDDKEEPVQRKLISVEDDADDLVTYIGKSKERYLYLDSNYKNASDITDCSQLFSIVKGLYFDFENKDWNACKSLEAQEISQNVVLHLVKSLDPCGTRLTQIIRYLDETKYLKILLLDMMEETINYLWEVEQLEPIQMNELEYIIENIWGAEPDDAFDSLFN